MNIIAAVQSEGNGIGINNDLLYRIPDDIKYFREMTLNKIVVMGYNTFKSLNCKPLSNRANIVLTSKITDEIICNNQDVLCDLKDISLGKESITFISNKTDIDILKKKLNSKIFIIGGASIYNLFINDCNRLYLTIIQGNKEFDTSFPDYAKTFKLSKHNEKVYEDFNENVIHYSFNIYKRK